jgi:hypothetical protein
MQKFDSDLKRKKLTIPFHIDFATFAHLDFAVVDTAILQTTTAATNENKKHQTKARDVFAAVSNYIYFILLVGQTF